MSVVSFDSGRKPMCMHGDEERFHDGAQLGKKDEQNESDAKIRWALSSHLVKQVIWQTTDDGTASPQTRTALLRNETFQSLAQALCFKGLFSNAYTRYHCRRATCDGCLSNAVGYHFPHQALSSAGLCLGGYTVVGAAVKSHTLYTQSSSQFCHSLLVSCAHDHDEAGGWVLTGLGPGGLGPPACLATMIWSTDRTVLAASVASLIAQLLVTIRSRMPASWASKIPVSSSFCCVTGQ